MRITGVGSLPHTDVREAAAFVAETTDLPYLPQLPNRDASEGMLRQWAEGLCGAGGTDDGIGLRHDEGSEPSLDAFGGARAMLDRVEGIELKTQFAGPLTLFLALLAAGCPHDGLWDCVVEGLVERVRAHIDMISAVRPGVKVIAVMDEPALVTFAPGRSNSPVSIDTAADAGSNRIGQLRFRHSRSEALGRQAAVLAVQQARRIAEDLAQAAGVTITRVQRISYGSHPRPGPMRAEMAMARSATPIEVGALSIERQVLVVFAIE